MNTNEHELILKEEVFDVVGCAMEALNAPGHFLFRVYLCLFVVLSGLNG